METYHRRLAAAMIALALPGGFMQWPRIPVVSPAVLPAAVVSPAVVSPAVVSPAVVSPAVLPASGPARSGFRWPLDGVPRPVRRFDPPPQPWQPGHRGVDLATEPQAVVRAAGAGMVLFAGQVAGRPVVSVTHSDGLRTTYEPVEPEVAAGDRVDSGDVLGRLLAGHPGCPAEACLHWGLRRGDEYLDPLALLGLGRVRLLPIMRSGRSGSVGWGRPAEPFSPGRRAGRAAVRRAGRTGRGGYRPARTTVATPDRSRS